MRERRAEEEAPSVMADEVMAAALGWPRPQADAKCRASRWTLPSSAVQVRSDFRSTALWLPGLVTDAEGRGTCGGDLPRLSDHLEDDGACRRAPPTGSVSGSLRGAYSHAADGAPCRHRASSW